MTLHGPSLPFDLPNFDQLHTPPHLAGYAEKVMQDLEKITRVYSGIQARIFSLNETGAKCTECVDAFTGQIVNSNCATCGGTGLLSGYEFLGRYKVIAQFSPKVKTSTQLGDAEGNRRRDPFILIRVPQLQDQDLIVTENTKRVYKIVDDEPQIVAIGGTVIMQVVQCAPLSKGAAEYKVINW